MDMEDEQVNRFIDPSNENEIVYDEEGMKDLVKICNICGERFSSGKEALCGHSRMHFAQSKPDELHPEKHVSVNHQGQKIKIKILMNGRCDDGDKITSGKNECVCCHKSFASQKALYGHMRSHPEREYRGLVPPVPLPSPASLSRSPSIHRNSSSSNYSTLSQDDSLKHMDDDDDLIKVSDDDLIKVSDTPLRWRCTGKRARKATLSWPKFSGFRSSEDEDEEDHEATNAALILMSLSAGKYYDDDSIDDDVRKTKKPRQVKKPGYLDEAGSSNHDGRYKCSICNKSFSSHQALGGHMSSHRKPVDQLKVKAEVDGEPGAQTGFHQCEICGKVFETGQALGGHKRCHRTIINYTDDSTLVESTQHQQQQQTIINHTDDSTLVESTQHQPQQVVAAQNEARVVFDFDLNEPAFVDDDDL